MLNERAMLVSLTIHQWTAQRHDKHVTATAEQTYNATNAGRFNKALVPKEALEPIRKIASAAREMHYKLTLPWGDNGDRLLPSKAYMDYSEKLREFKTQFERAVNDFLNLYPQLQQQAQTRLGLMFESSDYPPVHELVRKFGIEVSYSPVPSEKDFRVDLGEAQVKKIKQEISVTFAQRQEAAVKDCWARMRSVVEKIQERLSDEQAIFRDSLIENARELVEVLPKLNFNDDPVLDAMRIDIEERLLKPPQRLRDDLTLRSDTAAAATDILNRLKELG